MHKKSVIIKGLMLSVTILVAIAVPMTGSADEQPAETGNVVGSAVEVSNMLETSDVVTSSEVVISQENETHGVVSPPEATP